MKMYKIAVLDDYQNVALESADWSVLRDRADIAVFQNHLADPDAVIERLLPFDVVCAMRERTPLPRHVIERLPNLKLIASTGPGNASIDVAAAGERGIAVVHTGYRPDPTIELTWALILASARHLVTESNSVRSGGWQQTVGTDLRGKTLGVLGLGRIGSQVARVGSAFGMNLIAWSQNMTPEAATAAGAILVSKDQLFEQADILTIHLVLSSRTRGLVGAAELERMKPTARLINASRGPIVDEQALISVLTNKHIAGAAIDVFDDEPLPPSHPFRTLDNVLATPHIGYVSAGLYKTFYEDTVSNIRTVARHPLVVEGDGGMGNDPSCAALALKAWKTQIDRADKLFGALSSEEVLREIAPGRNRVLYLWGHLTAVHDAMLPLLGLRERLHPEFDVAFISNPDKSRADIPSHEQVRGAWNVVNAELWKGFEKMSWNDWVQRHAAVSEEDFAKDASRNRFAVLLSRTNHLSYHLGQAVLALKSERA